MTDFNEAFDNLGFDPGQMLDVVLQGTPTPGTCTFGCSVTCFCCKSGCAFGTN